MIEDMKIRNLSPHTIQAYVDRVAAFAKHFGKSPQLMGAKEVRTYLVFLVEEKRVSWSYYGQAICALRFLYRVTLGKDWVVKGVVSPSGRRAANRRAKSSFSLSQSEQRTPASGSAESRSRAKESIGPDCRTRIATHAAPTRR